MDRICYVYFENTFMGDSYLHLMLYVNQLFIMNNLAYDSFSKNQVLVPYIEKSRFFVFSTAKEASFLVLNNNGF